ncbi:hypothetical protein ANCCAN_20185 [Ancylostoma caninum]|uniref:Uncharacterized protein n=1 Tax=Ancylostoma caninum TaxID=29170 RepID=A0A368FPI4_ANCCA|nr:hypothetical protein ANCCAN_20185 [Ancylostoma caninum]
MWGVKRDSGTKSKRYSMKEKLKTEKEASRNVSSHVCHDHLEMKRPKLKTRRREHAGAESPHKDSHHSWNPNWLILVIAALAILPYIPSLDGEFVFDDSATILNNPIVTGKSHLKQNPPMKFSKESKEKLDSLMQMVKLLVFTTDYWGYSIASPQSHKSYRPLTTLTFW